jgi:hypothetical protein
MEADTGLNRDDVPYIVHVVNPHTTVNRDEILNRTFSGTIDNPEDFGIALKKMEYGISDFIWKFQMETDLGIDEEGFLALCKKVYTEVTEHIESEGLS